MKESVLKVFLSVVDLVVTNSEGYHVLEFVSRDLGPQNNQLCVLARPSEKGGKVVYLGFRWIQSVFACK